jgi:hypothetical protein
MLRHLSPSQSNNFQGSVSLAQGSNGPPRQQPSGQSSLHSEQVPSAAGVVQGDAPVEQAQAPAGVLASIDAGAGAVTGAGGVSLGEAGSWLSETSTISLSSLPIPVQGPFEIGRP